ncbi:unnamed protein product [Acanthoscelides obtectus]|nr:unnamed protein product [Acanthoscelides obtectus]CAK1621616.1 PIH1 domain-containing protein 1 [Acanthoscelides obtectus]
MASSSKKPVFLDVDSSIVEKNLRFAEDPTDEFKKIFEEPLPYPSKLVQPTPGFCVKAREVAGQKVFVNICKTEAIPPPKEISVKELHEIITSECPGDYRVPMSIGDVKSEKDNKGQQVKVIDVAIHPSFFHKVDTIEEFKSFFIAVVFSGLEDKYKIIFEDEKILLRNKRAFGKLQQHRIQQREVAQKMQEAPGQKSLISELTGETQTNSKVMIETISSTETPRREPMYRLFKKKVGQNCLYGEFKLPDVISAKEVTLDVGEDRIILESKARGYLLDIFVPYIVKQKGCTSTFDRARKTLTLVMPLVGG